MPREPRPSPIAEVMPTRLRVAHGLRGARVALAVLAAACTGERPARAAVDAGSGAVRADTGAPAPALGYQVVPLADRGRIAGRVLATGRVARDTIMDAGAGAPPRVCARTRRVALVSGRGDRVGGAVVWLGDAARGKALPVVRRYDVEVRRCAVRPPVQTAIAGGMLDVRNRDATTHLMRFLSGAAALDSVEETDAGQVVPTARVLARAGTVEVRCDDQPLPCAWIRVFDQPYYAVTRTDGSFVIDSVPPGDYELDVWHPRLGTSRTMVHVAAGRTAAPEIRFSPP